jgi:hypothetical protein
MSNIEHRLTNKGLDVGVLQFWMQHTANDTDDSGITVNPFAAPYLDQWFADNQTAWQAIVTGSRQPYCYRQYISADPNSTLLLEVLLPHLNEMRNLAKMGKWKIQFSLLRGDSTAALEHCMTVIRLGRHVQDAPVLIEQLGGIAISSLGHQQLLQIMSDVNLSEAQLGQLNQHLTTLYPDGYPLVNPEHEKLIFYDTVQHVFTNGGLGGGHIVPEQLSIISHSRWQPISRWGTDYEWLKDVKMGLLHARRNDTVTQANRLYRKTAEIQTLTPFQIRSTQRNIDALLTALSPHRYALIHYLMPALDRCFELGYRIKTEHAGVLTVLALQRWHKQRGTYPAQLDELVTTGLLRNVPQDPFGQGSLMYKLKENSFTLYSVGTNFEDDEGRPGVTRDGRFKRWTDTGDAMIWPVISD